VIHSTHHVSNSPSQGSKKRKPTIITSRRSRLTILISLSFHPNINGSTHLPIFTRTSLFTNFSTGFTSWNAWVPIRSRRWRCWGRWSGSHNWRFSSGRLGIGIPTVPAFISARGDKCPLRNFGDCNGLRRIPCFTGFSGGPIIRRSCDRLPYLSR